MRTYKPRDIVEAITTRRWLILIPFALGLAAVPLLARLVPEQYRSETLIMVVPQRVPDDYVKPTITETIEDRLPSISEQILSRSRLEGIITSMDLYKEQRERTVMEDVVQRMRRDVTVSLANGQDGANSFRVAYVSSDPDVARKVTEQLASLYIEQNLRDRENQADSTSEFIETQMQDAKRRLVEHEKKLEEYRKLHAGELPTQVQGNLQGIQGASMQLQALSESVNRALERRLLIERQIADTESLPVLEPAAPAIPLTAEPSTASQQLEKAKLQLTSMLQYYTPDHPEVVTMQRLLAELESRVESETPLGVGTPSGEKPPSAAALAQQKRVMDLKAELLVIDKQLESSRAEQDELRRHIVSLQAKVDALPSRESELVELTRDYTTLQAAYGNLLMKREDSAIAANLERRQIGEQFRIVDPASLPEKPSNEAQRAGVLVSGTVAGLFLGLLLAGVHELRDSSFRSEDEVAKTLALPVLALIPVMTSPREKTVATRRRRLKDIAGTLALCAAVAVVVMWRLQS